MAEIHFLPPTAKWYGNTGLQRMNLWEGAGWESGENCVGWEHGGEWREEGPNVVWQHGVPLRVDKNTHK